MNQDSTSNKKRIENIFFFICLLIYLVIHMILINHHEAWRDESQAWCLAKGSNLVDIWGQLSAEGHPILWFAFLLPFSHLGFKFEWISYLSLSISFIAAGVFLYKAPFKVYSKIIILCSSIFSFYTPVVARIYSLSLLIITLLACVYKDRHKKYIMYSCLVALLMQTHIIFLGLAIGLAISFLYELSREKNKILKKSCSLIFIFSFILVILELWQRSGSKVYINVTKDRAFERLNASAIKENIICLSKNIFYNFKVSDKFYENLIYFTFLSLVVLLIELFIYMKKNKENIVAELIIALLGIGYYFGIILLVRSTDHEQLAICLLMIIFFVAWICYGKMRFFFVSSNFIIALTIISVISISRFDYSQYYSMSKNMANYIVDNLNDSNVIFVVDNQRLGTPIAYIEDQRKDLIYLSANTLDKHEFFSWTKDYPKVNKNELLTCMKEEAKTKEVFLLDINEVDDSNLVLVHAENGENKWNECFYLYKYE